MQGGGCFIVVAFAILALASDSFVSANDNNMNGGPIRTKDFCVGTNSTDGVFLLEGRYCKDPIYVTANDFYTNINLQPKGPYNAFGFIVQEVTPNNLPGLNLQKLSLVLIHYAPNGGTVPLHIHPYGTEMLYCTQGKLLVGFITSHPNNTHYQRILNAGDIMVFPKGTMHYQQNIGNKQAIAVQGFSNGYAGFVVPSKSVFGSNPPIPVQVIRRSFVDLIPVRVINALIAFFSLLIF
ncbi:hypothetical protein ACFE04_025266 [Oxalis oulophora]